MICSLIDAGLTPEEVGDLDPVRTRMLYMHPRDEQGRLKLEQEALPGNIKHGEGKKFKERFWAKRQAQGKDEGRILQEWAEFVMGMATPGVPAQPQVKIRERGRDGRVKPG